MFCLLSIPGTKAAVRSLLEASDIYPHGRKSENNHTVLAVILPIIWDSLVMLMSTRHSQPICVLVERGRDGAFNLLAIHALPCFTRLWQIWFSGATSLNLQLSSIFSIPSFWISHSLNRSII